MVRFYCDRCGEETGDTQTFVYASKDLRHVTHRPPGRGPDKEVKRGFCRDCGDTVFAAVATHILHELPLEETK